ncbi:hypothetical protein TWF225_011325 [Orbilia oligospora]|uniref:Uncharacterized protein n=1 Tax=Orbilia oligospora TaxID=2813651 RepID=A0A7C8K4J1_ORBOL|nr:hypothetical protein TWF751_002838 [Orbilia oligospora]KAF3169433.1 hypothetical protein TWF225_011325 [Orbilia oligospora]KAF3244959.1 hypothetical protein TWF217_010581 [Orbilia oligospora]KAF3265898.1 hypothetical protein TWF128_011478 [Orbilia oligospora]TGJ74153.1 hypothetical protein EYR41_001190 [Orbilia oligospora]
MAMNLLILRVKFTNSLATSTVCRQLYNCGDLELTPTNRNMDRELHGRCPTLSVPSLFLLPSPSILHYFLAPTARPRFDRFVFMARVSSSSLVFPEPIGSPSPQPKTSQLDEALSWRYDIANLRTAKLP